MDIKKLIENAKALGEVALKSLQNVADVANAGLNGKVVRGMIGSPSFDNVENECVEKDGKQYWISRAMATCIVVRSADKERVLITQRAEKMNHGGKWCLPCGYVDWNETIYEAASRELFEEVGIYVKPAVFENVGFHEVVSDPKKDALENVTFHFLIDLDHEKTENEKEIPIVLDKKEVSDYKWVNKKQLKEYEFAFNHKQRIKFTKW